MIKLFNSYKSTAVLPIRHSYGAIRNGIILLGGLLILSMMGAGQSAQINAKQNEKKIAYGKISLRANSVDYFEYGSSSKKMFGRLKFLGGLSLHSSHPDFGGISGIELGPLGKKIMAVSDGGVWFTGELNYKGLKPVSITDAKIAPLKALSGSPLRRKREQDAEGILLLSGTPKKGTVLISFERIHRIGRFPITSDGIGKPMNYLYLPKAMRRLKRNKGLEAITLIKGGRYKGRVLAFAERKLTKKKGHLKGWILLGKRAKKLKLKRLGGFDVTDLASLPNGDVLVLERRFRWSEGIQMRLRLIPVAELASGRLIKGEVLLEADGGFSIDNMEGMAVHVTKAGNTIITLVSDDNFSILQRTLLLQFELLKKMKKISARN